MSFIGRKTRLQSLLFSDFPLGLIVPLDHGLTLGPIDGIETTERLSRWIGSKNISAVIGHKGLIERLIDRDMLHPATGIVVQLNGMPGIAPDPDKKIIVSNIVAALRLGADAVSVQVNFSKDNYGHNLSLLGRVVDEAHAYGMPVLTMAYDKEELSNDDERIVRINHIIRIVSELGSDAIKLAPPKAISDIPIILAKHCQDIQVYFAGGELCTEDRLCEMTSTLVAHGAYGLCIGRNVFQHPQPEELLVSIVNLMKSIKIPLRVSRQKYPEGRALK